jgi:hypothetical protein
VAWEYRPAKDSYCMHRRCHLQCCSQISTMPWSCNVAKISLVLRLIPIIPGRSRELPMNPSVTKFCSALDLPATIPSTERSFLILIAGFSVATRQGHIPPRQYGDISRRYGNLPSELEATNSFVRGSFNGVFHFNG